MNKKASHYFPYMWNTSQNKQRHRFLYFFEQPFSNYSFAISALNNHRGLQPLNPFGSTTRLPVKLRIPCFCRFFDIWNKIYFKLNKVFTVIFIPVNLIKTENFLYDLHETSRSTFNRLFEWFRFKYIIIFPAIESESA